MPASQSTHSSFDDRTTTVAELRELIARFVAERDWEQFHSPKNLAMSLAIEAAELMEHFQWIDIAESRKVVDDPRQMHAIGEEMADVVAYTLALANSLGIDISDAVGRKMVRNAEKYPVAEFRGKFGIKNG
jgi:dCTP diphosphatase